MKYTDEQIMWFKKQPQMPAEEIKKAFYARYPDAAPRSCSAIQRYWQRVQKGSSEPIDSESIDKEARLGRLADLLQRSGIDPDEIGKVERIRLNEWQGFYKDENSEAQVVDLEAASIVLAPNWDDGPAWPVVQQAPPVEIQYKSVSSFSPRGEMRVAAILPDAQIGYWRDTSGALHPTHDEAALDVALQVLDYADPDEVIFLGDNLDFPELGKYRQHPPFVQTTQPSIDRYTRFLGDVRSCVRRAASLKHIEGNHDIRLSNYILDNARAAFGLKRANIPESWPVLSLPYLCRFDDLDVEFVAGYPSSHVWLNDRLKCIHGHRAQRKSNAYPYLDEERSSIIYAHTHRREWAERTRTTRHGPRTIMAASPGCLCKIDGAVPSVKSGTDIDGMPTTNYEDWQQGLAIVYYTPDDGPFYYEGVPIHHGSAMWHGRLFRSRCDIEGSPMEHVA